jgi:hypothetical protein
MPDLRSPPGRHRPEYGVIGTGRPAANAGTFYPRDPASLGRLVDRLLADGASRLPDRNISRVVGAIVPHAGLEYSGAVAALGWTVIAALHPTTIVLAGTDHGGSGSGVAVWTGGPWANPLGEVPVAAALVERVAALGPPFHADSRAHLGEHSLEVQLPFLIRACPGVRIVPLLVSPGFPVASHSAGERLGSLLAGVRANGETTVVVASTDFAHYPSDAVAREVNRFMLEPILRLDEAELGRREAQVERNGTDGLVCGMCGVDPARLTLSAARQMGAVRGTLLGEATSADAKPRDTRRTVGYAAVALQA